MLTHKFDVKMRPDRVKELKSLSYALSHQGDFTVTWLDLLRQGADLVLATPPEHLLTKLTNSKQRKKGDR